MIHYTVSVASNPHIFWWFWFKHPEHHRPKTWLCHCVPPQLSDLSSTQPRHSHHDPMGWLSSVPIDDTSSVSHNHDDDDDNVSTIPNENQPPTSHTNDQRTQHKQRVLQHYGAHQHKGYARKNSGQSIRRGHQPARNIYTGNWRPARTPMEESNQTEVQSLMEIERSSSWLTDPHYRRTPTLLLSSEWVFKVKPNPDDTIENFKYRVCVCARGFLQKYGVDYSTTFSPVAQAATIKLLLAILYEYDPKVGITCSMAVCAMTVGRYFRLTI